MFNLVRNEFKKIFSRISTYIMLGLLVLGSAGLILLYHYVSNQSGSYWRSDYYWEIEEAERRIAAAQPGTVEYYDALAWKEEATAYQAYLDFHPDDRQLPAWVSLCVADAYTGPSTVTEDRISEDGYSSFEDYNEVYYDDTSDISVYVTQAFYDELQAKKQKFLSFVTADDWKGYYEYKLAEEENPLRVEAIRDMLSKDVMPYSTHWLAQLWEAYLHASYMLEYYDETLIPSGGSVSEEQYEAVKNQLALSKYRLDHQLEYCILDDEEGYTDYAFYSEYWASFYLSASMITFLSILMVIIAGGCVAKEFSEGTIKFLLINPTKRAKIFWSKYIMVLLFVLISTVGLFIFSGLLNTIVYGVSELNVPYLQVENGNVTATSGVGIVALAYAGNLISAMLMATLAFAISSIFRSSSLAIGISIAVFTMGSTITQVLCMLNQDWGRYLIFANSDPISISKGNSLFPHHSLTLCLAVIAVHLIMFLWTARDAFVRREV